jgi:hypothetical protein
MKATVRTGTRFQMRITQKIDFRSNVGNLHAARRCLPPHVVLFRARRLGLERFCCPFANHLFGAAAHTGAGFRARAVPGSIWGGGRDTAHREAHLNTSPFRAARASRTIPPDTSETELRTSSSILPVESRSDGGPSPRLCEVGRRE